MINLESLRSVQYVVDQQGRKSAVQIDLSTWSALLEYLEDLEDRTILKDKLAQLAQGPESAGAIPWDKVKQEW